MYVVVRKAHTISCNMGLLSVYLGGLQTKATLLHQRGLKIYSGEREKKQRQMRSE